MTGLIILGMLLIFALVMYWLTWLDTCGNYPRIKLKDFEKFYALNPERWVINGDYVGCKTDKGKYEWFCFGFIDYVKYMMWLGKLSNDKKAKAHMESTQRMLDSVKEDIAKAKAREATDSMVGIAQLLKDIEAQGIDCVPPSLIELLKKYDIE